jgi:hypothetical protein
VIEDGDLQEFAARLDAAGVTGIRWIELDAWPEG